MGMISIKRLSLTPRFSGVQTRPTALEPLQRFVSCALIQSKVIIIRVAAFIFSRLVTPGLGHLGTSAAPRQTNRRESFGLSE